MYTGNGAVKRFLIPSGYDGSEVYLIVGSQYVRLTLGTNYEISGGYIVFSEAVPSGVRVSFECPSSIEYSRMRTNSFTVIYGDGTISHVDEDPAVMLEEARKLLADTKAYVTDVKGYTAKTLSYIYALGEGYTGELAGRLLGYSTRAEDAINEAAQSVSADLRHEWAATLAEVTSKSGTVTNALQTMQALKTEMQGIVSASATQTAREVKADILEQCSSVVDAYSEMVRLKDEIQILRDDAEYAAQSAARELQGVMTRKVNEELELLKSLRVKMETDYDLMNTRIMNRFKLLKGGRPCRTMKRC